MLFPKSIWEPVELLADGEASADVAEPSGRNPELLQNQGTDGRSGSRQWKHQSAVAPWSGLPRSRLPAAEGPALGSHQDRIRRFPESRVEWTLIQILVQSPISSVFETDATRNHASRTNRASHY